MVLSSPSPGAAALGQCLEFLRFVFHQRGERSRCMTWAGCPSHVARRPARAFGNHRPPQGDGIVARPADKQPCSVAGRVRNSGQNAPRSGF